VLTLDHEHIGKVIVGRRHGSPQAGVRSAILPLLRAGLAGRPTNDRCLGRGDCGFTAPVRGRRYAAPAAEHTVERVLDALHHVNDGFDLMERQDGIRSVIEF
jgi:hypothetical protein